ncbi:UvrD-helicase domain-containing protein [Pseudoalteromonas ulvae]|uniref:DNA 3'-5' helicase n=1 Tax=Pseudoalteromonas ulvae TaxID=107327 RepID=A0A244CMU5_PSEDV|nr:UvrD-helicase domain-containing protein [Pseudoalteromonas ulvae]OUL56933.1 hypothetical protein B1199_16340 [Pseudoalteromonas ulvae]
MNVFILQAHFFARLFGFDNKLSIDHHTVHVYQNGQSSSVAWRDIQQPVEFKLGWFGYQIVIKIQGQSHVLRGMSVTGISTIQEVALSHWVTHHRQGLETAFTVIAKMVQGRFVRDSHVEQIQKIIDEQVHRWLPWAKSHRLDSDTTSLIDKLVTYTQLDNAAITAIRERYIRYQTGRYSAIFNAIESTPLTPKQAHACIVDNDANLILAGAGTGKTSVLIARVAYLLQSQQANSSELLLLAYGKQAATEMDQRLSRALAHRQVNSRTFHSLALAIVAEVEGKQPTLSKYADNSEALIHQLKQRFIRILSEDESYQASLVKYFNLTLPVKGRQQVQESAIQFIKRLTEQGQVLEFAVIICKLVPLYKSLVNPEQIAERIEPQLQPALAVVLSLLEPLRDDYQQLLTQEQAIDFDDMISLATHYVHSGQFKSPWRFIMVDEFQDISASRALLVKALVNQHPNANLFAVGDDWQAIYRFNGADLRLTTQFEHYFGQASHHQLTTTFRFNNKISQVAEPFILANPHQLKKQLNSATQVKQASVTVLTPDNALITSESALLHCLETMSQRGDTRIFILARNHFMLPDLPFRNTLQRRFIKLDIQFMTMHASKGKTADSVIIMGLNAGRHGFPSTQKNHWLADAFLAPENEFAFAEERRLFYVALTRAKHHVYLIAPYAQKSPFLLEILENTSELNQITINQDIAI